MTNSGIKGFCPLPKCDDNAGAIEWRCQLAGLITDGTGGEVYHSNGYPQCQDDGGLSSVSGHAGKVVTAIDAASKPQGKTPMPWCCDGCDGRDQDDAHCYIE